MKLLEVISSIGDLLSKKESTGDAFGRIVATAIDRLEPKKQLKVQLNIQQILLEYTD
jgi:hypothetical protein